MTKTCISFFHMNRIYIWPLLVKPALHRGNRMASSLSATITRSDSTSRKAASFSAGKHLSSQTITSTPLSPPTQQIESAKRLAAYAAVQRYVKPEHKIIGIGSGTTIPYCIEALLKQGEDANAEVGLTSHHSIQSLLTIPPCYACSAGSSLPASNPKNLSSEADSIWEMSINSHRLISQ